MLLKAQVPRWNRPPLTPEPLSDSSLVTEPEPTPVFSRFPWVQLVFCLACLSMAAWTWMRRGERLSPRRHGEHGGRREYDGAVLRDLRVCHVALVNGKAPGKIGCTPSIAQPAIRSSPDYFQRDHSSKTLEPDQSPCRGVPQGTNGRGPSISGAPNVVHSVSRFAVPLPFRVDMSPSVSSSVDHLASVILS